MDRRKGGLGPQCRHDEGLGLADLISHKGPLLSGSNVHSNTGLPNNAPSITILIALVLGV